MPVDFLVNYTEDHYYWKDNKTKWQQGSSVNSDGSLKRVTASGVTLYGVTYDFASLGTNYYEFMKECTKLDDNIINKNSETKRWFEFTNSEKNINGEMKFAMQHDGAFENNLSFGREWDEDKMVKFVSDRINKYPNAQTLVSPPPTKFRD